MPPKTTATTTNKTDKKTKEKPRRSFSLNPFGRKKTDKTSTTTSTLVSEDEEKFKTKAKDKPGSGTRSKSRFGGFLENLKKKNKQKEKQDLYLLIVTIQKIKHQMYKKN